MENKSKFVSLKRALPILSIVLLTTLSSFAQDSKSPITELTGKLVKLYPNPATSYVTFEVGKPGQKGITISIFNFLGKKISETQNVNEKATVQLAEFNRGMYIYHVTDAAGKVIDTGKFQVSR